MTDPTPAPGELTAEQRRRLIRVLFAMPYAAGLIGHATTALTTVEELIETLEKLRERLEGIAADARARDEALQSAERDLRAVRRVGALLGLEQMGQQL